MCCTSLIRPHIAKWQVHNQPGQELILAAVSVIVLFGDLAVMME